ncbi:hypothetical protein [Dyella lutea]|uniref:Uncharacterized protein n=1 Tax=Dyella lutea TaxID=2950441 RepID=A0ABT1F7C0_9GAMM|nr:hypothetical protein [Dyella lutea]MCP1373268.1 hypothetical protein [Dyella lutea]
MGISSIYGTQRPSPGGLAALRRAQPGNASGTSTSAPATAISRLPAADAGQWTAAIGAAMAQLGLAVSPGQAPAAATGTAWAQGDASTASRRGAQQVQQYRSIASTSSRLVQALQASASGASAGLTTALQGLWTSLGARPEGAGPAHPAVPHLPTFLQSLASHVGESGISGLRGVFVDAVA